MTPRISLAALLLVLALTTVHANAAEPVLRITVLTSGVVLVDGERTMVPLLEPELVALKARGGEVWYFREGDQPYPSQSGLTVFALLIKHHVPTSVSELPDFSDLVERDRLARVGQH